jgi:hypothetical protein
MIRRHLYATAALLLLAACADAPTTVQDRVAPAGGALLSSSTEWTIFTTQTPAITLSGSEPWAVATRFYTTQSGAVKGLRFWRAAGETGTNTLRLWTNSGTQLGYGSVSSGSEWKTVYFTGPICLTPYTYYRVSVNTNSKQVKTMYAFDNGVIANGPLVADGGYYGQPATSMPGTFSGSNFFVDVIFDTSIVCS